MITTDVPTKSPFFEAFLTGPLNASGTSAHCVAPLAQVRTRITALKFHLFSQNLR